MIWSEAISGVVIDVAFWWIGVENPDGPIEGLGDLSLEVSNKLKPAPMASCIVAPVLQEHASSTFSVLKLLGSTVITIM